MTGKRWVRVFYVKDQTVAEFVDISSGKVSYYDAKLIATKVAIGSDQWYLVKVEGKQCLKVLRHWNRKPIKISELKKLMA